MKFSRNYGYDRLDRVREIVKDKVVLDIGCAGSSRTGYGMAHKIIRKDARLVFGVDINKEGLRYMQKNGIGRYLVVADAYHLCFKKGFDLVFAGEFIEHVSNPGLFLDEVKEVLKENGILLISTPNAYSLEDFLMKLYYGDTYHVGGHVALWDECSLRRLVEDTGWQIKDFMYVSYGKGDSIIGKIFKRVIYRLFPWFSSMMLICCERKRRKIPER